ncbi:MAG: hypothetical protein JWM57_2454 [Phycisphaerales bacterium]|nr:hypothetical protein [Phycisphaerales bacterium]
MLRKPVRSIALAFLLFAGAAGDGMADDAASTHTAPMPARLWLRDGSVRNTLLIAQSNDTNAAPSPAMRFRTATGELTLWMDALVSISDVIDRPTSSDEASALFRIDRGTPRRLKLSADTQNVLIENEDGTREVVNLRKIARLQIVRRTAVARTPTE